MIRTDEGSTVRGESTQKGKARYCWKRAESEKPRKLEEAAKMEEENIRKLATEKAKKAAKKEGAGKHFIAVPIWLPLWTIAMILALTGGSSIHVLFLCLVAIVVVIFSYVIIEDSSFTKHYRMYLEQLQKGEMDAK